jgi:uncharacterized protein (DUF1015 family)
VRYAPDIVDDLGAVTSPPYDVLDPEAVLGLESADPYNVVRLILPRDEESGPEGRYAHAADTLRDWLAKGVLRVDDDPALYVYEQSRDGSVLQRGLLGCVGLHPEADRVVLPHEDVMPGPVADRLELMRALQANVEPILLMYEGGDGAAAAAVGAVGALRPTIEAATADGLHHRVWQLTDQKVLSAVDDDLAGRQALIADGHHRYAAYRALQSEHAPRTGDWDAGLAMLVDLQAYPPHVGAIHRVVAGMSLDEAARRAGEVFDAAAVRTTEGHDGGPPPRGWLRLADGRGRRVDLVARDPGEVEQKVARAHPDWRGLDTAVLHEVLFEELWQVPEDRVGYHHTVEQALAHAVAERGFAVLLAPVDPATVLRLAADGVRMPRKSTSFGPKPRTGLVLRTFQDG